MYFNASSTTSSCCLVTDSTSMATLVAARYFGEIVGTSAGRPDIQIVADATSVANSVTPEKSNSRSPSASLSYGSGFNAGSTPSLLALFSLAFFSHVGLTFGHRYAPVAAVENGGISAAPASNASLCLCVQEGPLGARRINGRKNRRGYFFRFGNEIHHHQKTGSGAYNQIAPHFDNDITWVDPSAWKLGHCQSDVWNMQLFNPALPFPPLFHHGPPHNNASLRT